MRYIRERTHHRSLWSDEDHARLAGLVAAGKTNLEIAIELGRSQESVRQRAVSQGLVPMRTRQRRTQDDQSL